MKKIINLVLSLTIIAGVCAAVLAFINDLTAEAIRNVEAKNREKAEQEVLCGQRGYAVEGRSSHGYGGEIVLMVGFAEDKKTVISYKVLSASETPGLGMNMTSKEFSSQFAGKDGTKLKVKKDGGEIEAITAATITSRAVCRAIASAAKKLAAENP